MERRSTSQTPAAAPKPRGRWGPLALTILLSPLLVPMLAFAFVMMVAFGLPVLLVNALVIQPLRLRKHIDRRGRALSEPECVARLSRGEGTLLIEELGAKSTRAWWTPDRVEPLPDVDLDHLDDLDDESLTPDIWTVIERTRASLEQYTSLTGGSALLVRRRKGAALGDQVRRSLGAERVVRLVAWIADLELDPIVCPACAYDLTGLEGPICPECGAHVGVRPAAAHAKAGAQPSTAASRAA